MQHYPEYQNLCLTENNVGELIRRELRYFVPLGADAENSLVAASLTDEWRAQADIQPPPGPDLFETLADTIERYRQRIQSYAACEAAFDQCNNRLRELALAGNEHASFLLNHRTAPWKITQESMAYDDQTDQWGPVSDEDPHPDSLWFVGQSLYGPAYVYSHAIRKDDGWVVSRAFCAPENTPLAPFESPVLECVYFEADSTPAKVPDGVDDERIYAYLHGSIERHADGKPKHLSEVLQAELDWLLATYDIAAIDAAKRKHRARRHKLHRASTCAAYNAAQRLARCRLPCLRYRLFSAQGILNPGTFSRTMPMMGERKLK